MNIICRLPYSLEPAWHRAAWLQGAQGGSPLVCCQRHVRPRPPSNSTEVFAQQLKRGDVVDVWKDGCWWPAAVLLVGLNTMTVMRLGEPAGLGMEDLCLSTLAGLRSIPNPARSINHVQHMPVSCSTCSIQACMLLSDTRHDSCVSFCYSTTCQLCFLAAVARS